MQVVHHQRVWRVGPPAASQLAESSYASFLPTGLEYSHCPLCERPLAAAVDALPTTVERGEPQALGDWTWSPISYDPLVEPAFAADLAARFSGFSLHPVVAPDRWSSRDTGKPLGKLPLEFREVVAQRLQFRVEASVPPEWAASSVTWAEPTEPPPVCRACTTAVVIWGRGPTELRPGMIVVGGVEGQTAKFAVTEDRRDVVHWTEHTPPSGAGAVFQAADVGQSDVWRMAGDQRAILCSDRFKAFIEARGSTNVEFLEAGAVVE